MNLYSKKIKHSDSESLNIKPSISVFINCPFDNEYRLLFDAIIFSTVCCGFLPRSALESGTVAMPRMERIMLSILSSKYSIHDLSRCYGEGKDGLARFNMPFELGIAMTFRHFSKKSDKHDWLLLVPQNHTFSKFISDLAGYDPKQYDGSIESIIQSVMSWLATRPDAVITHTPKSVINIFNKFLADKAMLINEWGDNIPWSEIIMAARNTASLL